VQLKYLETRLQSMDMAIRFTDAAVSELAKAGFDPVYGARPLKRAIQQEIENPLAKEILSGAFASGDTIHVRERNGRIVFAKKGAAAEPAAA